MDEIKKFMLGADDDGRRADRIVRKMLKNIPLSLIYHLFREGKIKKNGQTVQASERMHSGDCMEIVGLDDAAFKNNLPLNKVFSAKSTHEQPSVIWQNEHLIAMYKPRGMLTHDGEASLDAFVYSLLKGNLSPSVSFMPGPLHRLDRNTSGIILFSKTRLGAEKFSSAIRRREVRKLYLALVEGAMGGPLHLQDTIERNRKAHVSILNQDGKGGRLAVMDAVPLLARQRYTLVLVDLHTGITHQIRAQLAAHGFPLAGDMKYGGAPLPLQNGYFLHAYSLRMEHPVFEDMPNSLIAPLPESFRKAVLSIFRLEYHELHNTLRQLAEDIVEN
jgi:23S rRNA pseudouridine955/2504/2580 synthase